MTLILRVGKEEKMKDGITMTSKKLTKIKQIKCIHVIWLHGN
jgi:hypothetical protein